MYHFVYRVTFEETPYYYYGLHSTSDLDDGYLGSPSTHKWYWEFYEAILIPLEFFESRAEAGEAERKLILPFLNEPFCLNERCGSVTSIETCKKGGSISGVQHKNNKTGVCGRTPEEMSEHGRRGVESRRKNKVGWCDPEIQRELGRRGANVTSSQKWQNTDPDFEPYVSNPGGLTHWQKKRGIDTTNRVKLN